MASNRSFYDLNLERAFCTDGDPSFPRGLIADLRLSLPGFTEKPLITGLFLSGNTVRILFAVQTPEEIRAVCSFTSDERDMLRSGVTYPLKPLRDGYGGLIVFGEGVRTDYALAERFAVSEECCTRYVPSAVPSAGLVCDSVRLTGEVGLSAGGGTSLVSEGTDVPEELFGTSRALCLSVTDTGEASEQNPMIALANGINSYFGPDGSKSPVFRLFGAVPDETGTIRIHFDGHFSFLPVGDDPAEPVSQIVLASDLTVEEVCGSPEEDLSGSGEECEISEIQTDYVSGDPVSFTVTYKGSSIPNTGTQDHPVFHIHFTAPWDSAVLTSAQAKAGGYTAMLKTDLKSLGLTEGELYASLDEELPLALIFGVRAAGLSFTLDWVFSVHFEDGKFANYPVSLQFSS
jgi:hypothetical protein